MGRTMDQRNSAGFEEGRSVMCCGKKMKAYVMTKFDFARAMERAPSYKEVDVSCGWTRPDGDRYLCDECAEKYAGSFWRAEAAEYGEAYDEDEW